MSQPIYQGPPINENVPWDVRHHLQLIYQKLGIINQAFTIQDAKIATAAATSTETTTNVTVAGGGSGGLTPAPKGVLVGTGSAALLGVPSVSPGYILTDDGSGAPPAFKFPFIAAPQYAYANLPGSPTLGQVVCVTDATVNTWGANITTGGGTHFVLAWWNGTHFTVIGI